MPWLESHLDQVSALGEDPRAPQSTQASMPEAPTVTDGGAAIVPQTTSPAIFMGLNQKQIVTIAVIAVAAYFVFKKLNKKGK